MVMRAKGASSVSTIRISLPQTAASPAQARLQVSRFAAENDLLGQAGVALLVLSELVTNAVLHASEPIQVCVTSEDDCLRIEVSDGDTNADLIMSRAPKAAGEPGGRGLQIVNSLARRWGVTQNGDGKTVWAEVGLESDPDD
jgi:anti-sigma regulatory factor (Ser/Thr protein kinase)